MTSAAQCKVGLIQRSMSFRLPLLSFNVAS
jgi:hypothetical protein